MDELLKYSRIEEKDGSQMGKLAENKIRVFDLHCDTLDRLALHGDFSLPGGFAERDASVPAVRMSSLQDNEAHLSLNSMQNFHWCQCFAAYVPDELKGEAAWQFFRRVTNYWREEAARCADLLVVVRNSTEAEEAFATHKTAGMLTVEGLSFLEDDSSFEESFEAMVAAGVRMTTLVWNNQNALASGSKAFGGLTAFGKRVVLSLEDNNIAIDVSHLNEEGFKDLLKIARKPFAASHSNAFAVCAHPRNLKDWQLKEIAARGGVVGLNYFEGFLCESGHATPSDVLCHVDHILNTAGEEVLALGSDYDGSDVPAWLEPCTKVVDLFNLIEREFGTSIARKIFYENAARFFRN